MYEIKKNAKVFTSKFVNTGPSCYEKRIYWSAVSQRLRNNGVESFLTSDNHSVSIYLTHARTQAHTQTHTLTQNVFFFFLIKSEPSFLYSQQLNSCVYAKPSESLTSHSQHNSLSTVFVLQKLGCSWRQKVLPKPTCQIHGITFQKAYSF